MTTAEMMEREMTSDEITWTKGLKPGYRAYLAVAMPKGLYNGDRVERKYSPGVMGTIVDGGNGRLARKGERVQVAWDKPTEFRLTFSWTLTKELVNHGI